MVISGVEPRSAGALPSPVALSQNTSSAASTASFAQQIEAALEQYLGQAGIGSGVEIDIQPQGSQASGEGQFLVTVKPQAASPSSAALGPLEKSTPLPTSGSPSPVTPQPAPQGYQSVPFGSGTTMVPMLATEIARQNAMMAVMSPEAILNQDKVSAAGDPMSGQTINGTDLKWDDLTQDQQLAYIYAMNYGLPQGQSMQAYLEANFGPKIMANAPSTNPTLFS